MMRLVTLVVLLGLAGTPALSEDAPRQITVTGMAEAEATPDLATITAGVETRADTAAAALAANSETMADVLSALDASGIERRDVQTSDLSISPVYEPYRDGADQAQRIIAYEASNMVTVRSREISTLGETIDAVTGAGANRIFGINFGVADPKPTLDAARQRAVADARAKAELFAGAAGVKLGPVLSISETTQGPGPIMMRAEAMAEAAPPVEAGTVTLQAQVTIVFELE
jgi:uncharacterized protein